MGVTDGEEREQLRALLFDGLGMPPENVREELFARTFSAVYDLGSDTLVPQDDVFTGERHELWDDEPVSVEGPPVGLPADTPSDPPAPDDPAVPVDDWYGCVDDDWSGPLLAASHDPAGTGQPSIEPHDPRQPGDDVGTVW